MIGASECNNIRLLLSLLLHETLPNCQVDITEYNLPQVNPCVAKQKNAVDCGIFTLGFTRLIINHFSELSFKSDIVRDRDKANQSFAFLRNDVGMFESLRARIQTLIMRIASSSETHDLFAVEEEGSEESDIECVEVNMKKKKPPIDQWLEAGHREKQEKIDSERKEKEEKERKEKEKEKEEKERKEKEKQERKEKEEKERKEKKKRDREKREKKERKEKERREEEWKRTEREHSQVDKENSTTNNRKDSSHDVKKSQEVAAYFPKHQSSRARTIDSPHPSESYKNSFSSLLQAFQTHQDPISRLKPAVDSTTKQVKRERDWKLAGSDSNGIKPKKRKYLGYTPINNL